jgi:hypothetical protein
MQSSPNALCALPSSAVPGPLLPQFSTRGASVLTGPRSDGMSGANLKVT